MHSSSLLPVMSASQLGCAVELLRPNVKDVLYTLEANTFRDGLLQEDDHAGAGVMWARMGEGGKIKRGPSAMGYRVQESMALGPFDVSGCCVGWECSLDAWWLKANRLLYWDEHTGVFCHVRRGYGQEHWAQ